MLETHRTSWLLASLLGATAGVLLFGTPVIWAQNPAEHLHEAAPLTAGDIDGIHAAMYARSTSKSAEAAVQTALHQAETARRCLIRREGLDHGRRALALNQPERAATLANAYLAAEQTEQCSSTASSSLQTTRARLLWAHAELQRGRPHQTLERLSEVDASETPIRDYVWWIEARALAEAGSRESAANLYGRIFELGGQTPLAYRARARQTDLLAETDRCSEALPVIEQMLDLFPDYPHRARLQFQRADCHQQLGDFRKAADIFQQTWLLYPHKPHGDRALARLETLERRGTSVPPISRERLFDRFRQLRIYRQWQLAGTYFKRLLDHASTPGGHSEFEHRIKMQLALNAFEPKQHRKALDYLRELRAEYRAGHDEGIHEHIVDKYLSRTLARMGRFDQALAAQKRRLDRYGRYTRRRELIDFYETHGRYEKAFQMADSFYSAWRKHRWRYGWLLYKTGRFDRAVEHFRRYARRRHGHTRAKGLYWAARAHERADRPKKARPLYNEIARESPLDYYGVQAVNRLRDLEQRHAVDSAIVQKTESVLDSGKGVFAAFDRAANAMADDSAPIHIDSSLVPRVPAKSDHATSRSVGPGRCAGAPGNNPALCRLMAGNVPDKTRSAITRALAPFSGLGGSTGRRTAQKRATRTGRSTSTMPADGASPSGRHGDDDTGQASPPPNRVNYATEGRIYWGGRHDSNVAFARYSQGKAVGPIPEPRAYGSDEHIGGLERAVDKAGKLFPDLERARWLYQIGLQDAARTVLRGVTLEFRGLARRPRAPEGNPHELPYQRWTYLVDFRPRGEQGLWGYDGEEVPRFPVPEETEKQRKLADRHQKIWDRRETLRPLFVDALKEVGDYHLVRKFTYEQHDLYHQQPTRLTRQIWMQAYPRAFPRKVIAESRKRGINPYLIWSLMGVESTYNPDSVSTAEAIGLLQVIPRTGIKVATSIGDDDFGHYDLVDEEVAIEQGVWYFSRLVRKFRGQELLAMAGYNGGPHRVAAWMNKRGRMPLDEFVEEIPFTQARGYVKKVTRYLATYMRLYEDRRTLYIGQNVNTNYRAHPNY